MGVKSLFYFSFGGGWGEVLVLGFNIKNLQLEFVLVIGVVWISGIGIGISLRN